MQDPTLDKVSVFDISRQHASLLRKIESGADPLVMMRKLWEIVKLTGVGDEK